MNWTNLVGTNTKPNGEFVLSNVDPGRYDLYAMVPDIKNRRVWTGHMRVEVRDKNLTGLNITVSPGVTLQGEVVINGGGAIRPETLRIVLQFLGTLPPQVASAIGTVPVDASGKFHITGLSDGRYRRASRACLLARMFPTSYRRARVSLMMALTWMCKLHRFRFASRSIPQVKPSKGMFGFPN